MTEMKYSDVQKYERTGQLGEGMYKAERTLDRKRFAIWLLTALTKEDHDKQLKSLERMLKLKHKNIVSCLDYFTTTVQLAPDVTEWQLHIVTPYYKKGSLHSHIQKRGPLPQGQATQLLKEMSSALQYANEEGYIHGNVQPKSIMLAGDQTDGANFFLSLRLPEEAVESTFFTAPECDGGSYTSKVDMWSLGVTVCYSVLQSELRNNLGKYLREKYHLVTTNLLPKALSAPLDEILLRLVSADPVERLTAAEVLEALPQVAPCTPVSRTDTESDRSDSTQDHHDLDLSTCLQTADSSISESCQKIKTVFKEKEQEKEQEQDTQGTAETLVDTPTAAEQPCASGDGRNVLSQAETPLCAAAAAGHVEIVKQIQKSRSKQKTSWRRFACMCGQPEQAKFEDTWKALHAAVVAGHVEVVKLLYDTQTATMESSKTLLLEAAKRGHVDVTEFLIDGCRINPLSELHGETPLLVAVGGGHCEVIKLLLKRLSKNNYTPTWEIISHAAHKGHIEALKLVIPNERSLKAMDCKIVPLLHVAAKQGYLDIVEYLVERGQDPTVRDSKGFTALYEAALNNHTAVVEYLKKKRGPEYEPPSPRDQARKNKTSALHAAAQGGHIDLVRNLIDIHNEQVDSQDEYGHAPIHKAAQHGHLDVVKLLVNDYEQSPVMKAKYDINPYYLSALKGHLEIVKYFANMVEKSYSQPCVHAAAIGGHAEIVRYLIDVHEQDPGSIRGNGTPLYDAAANGNFDVVKLLVDTYWQNPHVSADPSTRTPSDIAYFRGYTEIHEFLKKVV